MENTSQINSPPGSRQLNVKKSFKVAMRTLLTVSSKEEFCKAFLKFTSSEQEVLHRLFIQVITSLHERIEDEFETVCLETQMGPTLDTVEHLVEEQSLDRLFPDKTNIGDIAQHLSATKKSELQYLMDMLEKAEEQKRIIKARVELLKKKSFQDLSGATDAIEKLKTGISNYGRCTSTTTLQ
ncbi:hypothetical protein LguiA_007976 [Lonicera macranthoides]